MEKLPALNSIKQCPKCLADTDNYNKYFKYKYLYEYIDLDQVPTETIERTCYRCDYTWLELCGDVLPQGESTSDKNCITNGTNNYPPLFSDQHFEDTNKIGETLINSLKEKGFTKSSSTKCPASQDLFNLNHTRINLYCSLPRGHKGQHQITLHDNNKQLLEWKWSDDSFDRDAIAVKAGAEARAEMISNSLLGMFRHKANNNSDDED